MWVENMKDIYKYNEQLMSKDITTEEIINTHKHSCLSV